MQPRQQGEYRARTESAIPLILCFLLGLMLTAVFCWRVASTDPSWKGPVVKPRTASVPQPTVDRAESPQSVPDPKSIASAPQQSVAPKTVSQPPRSVPVAPSSAEINAYLSTHLGGKIPLLRGNVKRDVTLVAFTDEAIMVRVGKDDQTTLPRNSFSVEQLNLWKK